MNSQQALEAFWNGFSWNAFQENSVPDNAFKEYRHYITYTAAWDEFGRPVMLSASIWERSTSWASVIEKAEEIKQAIGFGGTVITHTDGAFWIKRGNPFYQRMPDEDDTVRRVYLNIEVEYFSE